MTMRKYIFTVVAMAVFSFATASAQIDKRGKKSNAKQKVGEFLNDAKDAAEQAGSAISEFFGFDDRVANKEDLIKIKRNYYMPLYSVNLYDGADAQGFPSECRALFASRYPQAEITSIALPQTDWIKEELKKDDEVVGHMHLMYCYIIARDGDDGYINARFTYKKYKQVGHEALVLNDSWPKWERTDYLSHEIYSELKEK